MTDPQLTHNSPGAPLTVCVVSHTHWDREWYHSAGRFRQGLVALVDALLQGEISGTFPMLLDGQAVVLEDYLSVRPEMVGELSARLQSGELEAGPWYVLADGLIPSAEAIVRNLLVGRRVLRRFGATAPGVAYCPDTFGHSAAMPTIAAGFGFPVAIVWRGYGSARSPKGDVANWISADGSNVLLYHLPPDGYETGSALPSEGAEVSKRWEAFRALMQARSATGVVLMPNGADHHALQPDIERAVENFANVAAPSVVVRASLQEFADRLQASADSLETLPTVNGELRDSYGYTWTLNGTFGTRAHQKRANARAERLLLRDVEPWSVLAWLHGGNSARKMNSGARVTLAQIPALLDANWRTLLRAHPHDTLCGCSIDTVARAMEARIESAVAQAKGLRAVSLQLALQHDSVSARNGALSATPQLVVRNRVARKRGGLAEVLIDETIADVPVGPSSASAADAVERRGAGRPIVADFPLQTLRSRQVYRRRESPQHYPDNDLVREHRALVWVPPVPAIGVAVHAISWGQSRAGEVGDRVAANGLDGLGTESPNGTTRNNTILDGLGTESPNGTTRNNTISHSTVPTPSRLRVIAASVELSNGQLSMVVSDGGVHLTAAGRTLHNAITFESTRDVGDSYTPAIRGEPEVMRVVRVRPGHAGPLRASVVLELRTARRRNGVRIRAELMLDAESHVLRIDVAGNNQRRDHRLRVNFNTDVSGAPAAVDVWADAAFGPVDRPPLNVPVVDQAREMVPATMPMHRWVTMSGDVIGATLHSDGLAEVEANQMSGTMSLTLLRAIGELTRNNLPERPGHAGWPAPIPLAQSLGVFHARIGLQLHANWSQPTRDAIEDASDALLLPLTGDTWRDLAPDASEISGPELHGSALRLSTISLADDGDGIVLRCVNDSKRSQNGAWVLPDQSNLEFARARFDETVQSEWQGSDGRFAFVAGPREVVTVRVRNAR